MDEQFIEGLKNYLQRLASKYDCDFRGSNENSINYIQLLEKDAEVVITVTNNPKLAEKLKEEICDFIIKAGAKVDPPVHKPIGILESYYIKWYN